ncbi:hypothetical protein AMTR_s00091p00078960 [Amborella trichopoda]|uniref:Uncharacterized protein n=1 Tax=Amborella trichopoda TaxID=13333 RepID=W1NZ62_AMBTC|nr:hypothetical protein AMTR_s00091p00078960 [Amborella trichopoda]
MFPPACCKLHFCGRPSAHHDAPSRCLSQSILQSHPGSPLPPHRDDLRGIGKWGKELWLKPDLTCRKISSSDFLFSFPFEGTALRALQLTKPQFKGATLSFSH